jgi:4-alpha-glucanotransferase
VLVAASLSDAVGDTRQPNMPGTVDEYPNWRLPLAEPADGGARPVLVDDLSGHAGANRLAEALRR